MPPNCGLDITQWHFAETRKRGKYVEKEKRGKILTRKKEDSKKLKNIQRWPGIKRKGSVSTVVDIQERKR
jgi:hypothetical protein